MRITKLFLLFCVFPLSALTQQAGSATPAAPTPLSTPSITGPLQAAPPFIFDAGPLGKLSLNGAISGVGLWQSNPVAGDKATQAALNNGQVFVQKTDGWWQFYVQAGAYTVTVLGTPFISTEKAITDLWGPVPVAYLKLVPGKTTSILVGALPTIMGAEYTFDFQNMNVQRGLLWNQENAINRGIQLNQAIGKFSAWLSWNDGYYSNRYSWLTGSLAYLNGPHSLAFMAMGNLGQTRFQTFATPVQNNSSMYALAYTCTKGPWIVQPYYQYSNVPTNLSIGIGKGASTQSGAVLASRSFKHGLSLAGRAEFIATSGSAAERSVNLLYGPGSAAWSLTATPAWQHQRFFLRGDVSLVRAESITAGSAFGASGTNQNQARGVLEARAVVLRVPQGSRGPREQGFVRGVEVRGPPKRSWSPGEGPGVGTWDYELEFPPSIRHRRSNLLEQLWNGCLNRVLNGHGFTGCRKTRRATGLLSGHDFIRAEEPQNQRGL